MRRRKDKIKQGRTIPDKMTTSNSIRHETKQDKARQDKTRQDKTGQNRTRQSQDKARNANINTGQ
jgi:hypothetical protein